MEAPPVLVTGCARSGTGYAAALLTRLGIPCGHEHLYAPRSLRRAGGGRLDVAPAWPEGLEAESSWLAAPFLGALPQGTLVLHQVRHPLAVVRSNLRVRFLSEPSDYLEVARTHLPGLDSGGELERAARYWVRWNALVEDGVRDHGLRCVRYRLEELDQRLVRELVAVLGHEVAPADVAAALDDLPPDINTRGLRGPDVAVDLEDLCPGPLRDELEAGVRRYGYADVAAPLPRGRLPQSLGLF